MNTTQFGIQDWTATYQQVPQNPLLSSYDFETLRKSMLLYLQLNNPESYNDYINSSEYIALVDLIAFMGQSLSYRIDMNARESFLSTATTRNAIVSLANLVSYHPSRNLAANGYLKITSISVNDDVYDSLGNNLNGLSIVWNDKTNRNWLDQWNAVMNAILINSQTVGTPANTQTLDGISVSEYNVNVVSTSNRPYSFSSTIDGTSTAFEIVNPSTVGQTSIYEVGPLDSSYFNFLYENDGTGYASQNTGFFAYFKQGTRSSETFTVSNALPNYSYTLNATGVNDTDVWVYQQNSDGSYTKWTEVDSIYADSAATGTIYSITNTVNDGITLVFGDGVFGDIPSGTFIVYTRTSNGQTYRINPSEMTNIAAKLSYTSKTGRTQTVTFKASLQYTVGNSAPTESLANIKLKAPQHFYSQNRMVNGQDYNSLPYTKFSNILKVKAVNRTSSGVSRYLDVNDPTGKYSSTNIFCDDGFMYLDDSIDTNTITYSTNSDLASSVQSLVNDAIASSGTMAFVLNNYTKYDFSSNAVIWNLVLNNTSSSSGYLAISEAGTVVPTSSSIFSEGYGSILVEGALIKFVPPSGYMFDSNNLLVVNTTGIPALNQKDAIYAAISASATNEGYGDAIDMDGVNIDGTGAITLNQIVPTNAILSEIYPYYSSTIPSSVVTNIIKNVVNGLSVSLQYYPTKVGQGTSDNLWVITTSPTFPLGYSPTTYGTTFYQPTDSSANASNSWLISFVPASSSTVTMYCRNNSYYFGSVTQTSFYYDGKNKVYNPANSSLVTDRITILKSNSGPSTSTNLGLSQDISVDIMAQVSKSNGLTDTSRIQVQYADLYSTGTPSDPSFFDTFVATTDYVFLKTDNTTFETSVVSSGITVSTPSVINANLYSYTSGTIVYCKSNQTFYEITRTGTTVTKTALNASGDTLTYSVYRGRKGVNFKYIHNAANNRRIDPSPANIIDLYILENSYATAYQQWVTDTTGSVSEPTAPTTATLSSDFSSLNNYKMISDELIFNSAKFVPLFGSKADTKLQATFVAVSNPNYPVSSGEIASRIITLVNEYFEIGNFSFGQTFYWSPLSNYIMTNIGNIINSIHLVPTSSELSYGNLEEITCDPYEIFISCATIADVTVVSNLTSINLKIS